MVRIGGVESDLNEFDTKSIALDGVIVQIVTDAAFIGTLYALLSPVVNASSSNGIVTNKLGFIFFKIFMSLSFNDLDMLCGFAVRFQSYKINSTGLGF